MESAKLNGTCRAAGAAGERPLSNPAIWCDRERCVWFRCECDILAVGANVGAKPAGSGRGRSV
jgi:hypothetical protein